MSSKTIATGLTEADANAYGALPHYPTSLAHHVKTQNRKPTS